MEEPSWSRGALAYTIFNAIMIVISVITFIISSLPIYFSLKSTQLPMFYVEIGVIIFFTVDYVGRFVLTRQPRLKWSLRFLNVIDLISVLPFYFEIFIISDNSLYAIITLRILRLLRVLRLVKMARYSAQLPVVVKATKKSGTGFVMALFSMFLFMVLFASAMFYAEQTESYFDAEDVLWKYTDGTISPFQSIPHALWWTIVTMTTVGYGDNVPLTGLGKMVASFAMICGILVLAFPLTILAGNFSAEYSKHLINKSLKDNHKNKKAERKKNNAPNTRVKPPKELLRAVKIDLEDLKLAVEITQEKILIFDKIFDNIEENVRKLTKYVRRRDFRYQHIRRQAKYAKQAQESSNKLFF